MLDIHTYVHVHVQMLHTSLLWMSTCVPSGISSSESELTSDNEEPSEQRNRAGSGLMYNVELNGEHILFPESDGEESDWIDSDSEDRGLADAPIEGVDSVDNGREGFIVGSGLSVRHFYFMFSSLSCTHTCMYTALPSLHVVIYRYVHVCIYIHVHVHCTGYKRDYVTGIGNGRDFRFQSSYTGSDTGGT